MFLTTLLLVTGLGIYPPKNSVFAGKSKFFIGKQNINLSVRSDQDAFINMKGIVNAEGSVKYIVKDDQTMEFVFSEAVSKVLEKFRCKIRHVVYNPTTQIARVNLHVYNMISHTMTLRKQSNVD